MKNAVHLFVLMFIQYGVLTINTRAIAGGNQLWLALTDLVVATLGFTILKKAVEATTRIEMYAYALGGTLGAQAALLISQRLW